MWVTAILTTTAMYCATRGTVSTLRGGIKRVTSSALPHSQKMMGTSAAAAVLTGIDQHYADQRIDGIPVS